MGSTENTLLTGTLIVTLIDIGLITFLLTWGLLIISPRQNKFDQPAHTAELQQRTLLVRIGFVSIFFFLLFFFGLLGTVISSNAHYPDSAGKGGIPPEMPYNTITQLKTKIEDTLYNPQQTLNHQTHSTLISLDTALTAYQQEYTSKTYPNWDAVQNLLVYMEETEEKLPELSQEVPKYNDAKESLTKYVEANEPYIAPPDAKRPLWLYKSVWLERPFWQYLMGWGLVGLACVLGVFSGYSLAHSTVRARHTPKAADKHKQDLKTAVLNQLSNRYPPDYHFHFIRDDAKPNNKGYFFIVHCFDQPIPENESLQTLPINYLIFYVDTNGQIEDPIFAATTIQNERGTRQEISIDARASLIEKLTKKLNNEEINDLIITLALPITLTDLSHPQEKRVAIVNVLLQQGQICDLFIFLQRRHPQENWLRV